MIQQIEEVPFFAPLLFFILMLSHLVHSKLHTAFHSIHQQGQAFDLLVSVSCIHYCTSTSDLSTSSSSRGLIDFCQGYLILRGASRLDAFSVYPVPTWLPGYALGNTTGTPEVSPPRSSRTKGSSSQISYARAG